MKLNIKNQRNYTKFRDRKEKIRNNLKSSYFKNCMEQNKLTKS